MRDRVAVAADYALRLAFFALVPRVLVYLTAYFPLGGALFNVTFAVVVVMFGAAIRRFADTRPWLARILKRQLAFEEYYRAHPSRRFLYYALYPVLFPYWLWDKRARREFLLFKGYTVLSVVLLFASNIYQFFHYWRPELHFGQFFREMMLVLVIETLVTLSFLVPISTTIINFSIAKRTKGLVVLLVVALGSAAWEVVKLAHLREPIVSSLTRARVGYRVKAAPDKAQDAETAALEAAFKVLDDDSSVVTLDGDKIQGPALVAAHDALHPFFKRDEVKSFDLWATSPHHPDLLVVYSEQSLDKSHAIWLALKNGQTVVHDVKTLPPEALRAMKHTPDL
jgi:hypothetical protein